MESQPDKPVMDSGLNDTIALCTFVPVQVGLGLASALTCVVCLWIISSIAVSARLHSISNFFLANHCLVQFLNGSFGMWTALDYSPEGYSAQHSATIYGCLLLLLSSYFLNSVVIAADRYYKIARPMTYLRLLTNKVCFMIIGSIWVVSVTIASITSFATWTELDGHPGDLLFQDAALSTLKMILISVSAPMLAAITILVFSLIRIARQQQRRVRDETVRLEHLWGRGTGRGGAPFPRRHPLRSVLFIVAYLIMILLCWVPFLTYLLLSILWDSDRLFFAVTVGSIFDTLQIFFSTLFLVYTQREHRLVLRRAILKLRQSCTCTYAQ